MMQCRMCSQRLTRPGRLCRECECELERARQVGVAAGEPAAAGELLDVPAIVGGGWAAPMRAPVAIVATAFAVGIAGAVALHVADTSHVRAPSRSVMLATGIVPQDGALHEAAAASWRVATARARVAAEPMTRQGAQPITQRVVQPGAQTGSQTGAQTGAQTDAPPGTQTGATSPEPRRMAWQAPAAGDGVRADPAHALGVALSRCGDESFFARPACEERARARYCADAAASLPQCAVRVREYGQ